MILASLLVWVFYGSSSISSTILSRMVFSVYEFRSTFLLLLCQFFISLVMGPVWLLLCGKPIKGFEKLQFHRPNWKDWKDNLGVGSLFYFNILLGNAALVYVNVPMFLALRRTAVVFTFAYERLFLKKQISNSVGTACIIISAGAVLAAASDLKADYLGFLFVILNNTVSAVWFNLNKSVCDKNPNLNALGQTWYNSTICLPMSILCAWAFGDIDMAMKFDYTPNMLFFLFLSAVAGISITISQILCNIFNSPITTTITMNMKDLVGTIAGIVLFNDVILTPWFVAGLCLSLFGACYYSFVKFFEMKEAAEKAKSK